MNKEKIGSRTKEYFRKMKELPELPEVEKRRREKIRQTMSGRKPKNFELMLRKAHTPKTYEKIGISNSEAMKGKHNSPSTQFKVGELRGDKHPNWKGGIAVEKYGFEFTEELKESIRRRDGYRCQQCFRHQNELFTKDSQGNVVSKKLPVHHIDYDKHNNNQDNLISLCPTCHAQTSFSREDWTEYFREKVANG